MDIFKGQQQVGDKMVSRKPESNQRIHITGRGVVRGQDGVRSQPQPEDGQVQKLPVGPYKLEVWQDAICKAADTDDYNFNLPWDEGTIESVVEYYAQVGLGDHMVSSNAIIEKLKNQVAANRKRKKATSQRAKEQDNAFDSSGAGPAL